MPCLAVELLKLTVTRKLRKSQVWQVLIPCYCFFSSIYTGINHGAPRIHILISQLSWRAHILLYLITHQCEWQCLRWWRAGAAVKGSCFLPCFSWHSLSFLHSSVVINSLTSQSLSFFYKKKAFHCFLVSFYKRRGGKKILSLHMHASFMFFFHTESSLWCVRWEHDRRW